MTSPPLTPDKKTCGKPFGPAMHPRLGLGPKVCTLAPGHEGDCDQPESNWGRVEKNPAPPAAEGQAPAPKCVRCKGTLEVTMSIDEHGMQDVFPCPDCGVEEHPPLRVNPESALALQYTCRILDGMKQSLWLTECAASEDRKDLHVWLIEILKEFRAAAPVAPPHRSPLNEQERVQWAEIDVVIEQIQEVLVEESGFTFPPIDHETIWARLRDALSALKPTAALRPVEQGAPFRAYGCVYPIGESVAGAEQPSAAAPTLCNICNHSLENNEHGFDQNDGHMEGDKLVLHGTCTYCRICNPRMAAPAHGGEPQFCSCEIPTLGKTTPRCGTCNKLHRVAAPSAEAQEPMSATEFYMKEFKEVPHKFQDWMHFSDIYGEYREREGLEEAARLVCDGCKKGFNLSDVPAGYMPNYGTHYGGWIHTNVEESNAGLVPCHAAEIWADLAQREGK